MKITQSSEILVLNKGNIFQIILGKAHADFINIFSIVSTDYTLGHLHRGLHDLTANPGEHGDDPQYPRAIQKISRDLTMVSAF